MAKKKLASEQEAAAEWSSWAAQVRGRYYLLMQEGYTKEEAAKIAEALPRGVKAAPLPVTPIPKVEPAKPFAVKTASVQVDDLMRISGVSSGAVRKLNDMGVTMISQIAAWKPRDVEDFDSKLGYRGRIKREDWVGQAKALLGGG